MQLGIVDYSLYCDNIYHPQDPVTPVGLCNQCYGALIDPKDDLCPDCYTKYQEYLKSCTENSEVGSLAVCYDDLF